jgi:quercetin dioxygenase-like cupin family protein
MIAREEEEESPHQDRGHRKGRAARGGAHGPAEDSERRAGVIGVKIGELELLEKWYEDDPTMRVRVNFPLYAGSGTRSSAVVYFELEPGFRLGTHTDSAEETLLILQGEAEATVGEESDRIEAGEMAVVPAMVPHALRNVGEETLRVVGFFSSNVVASVFDRPMMPAGRRAAGTPPVLVEE